LGQLDGVLEHMINEDSIQPVGTEQKHGGQSISRKSASGQQAQWFKRIEEADKSILLKELAATWSFELSARFINDSLARIQVFSQNYGQHQQWATAQGTANFNDVCEDIRRSSQELLLRWSFLSLLALLHATRLLCVECSQTSPSTPTMRARHNFWARATN